MAVWEFTQVRNHVCQSCGTAYRLKHPLNHHERLHTGEKPYICETWETFQNLGKFKSSHACSCTWQAMYLPGMQESFQWALLFKAPHQTSNTVQIRGFFTTFLPQTLLSFSALNEVTKTKFSAQLWAPLAAVMRHSLPSLQTFQWCFLQRRHCLEPSFHLIFLSAMLWPKAEGASCGCPELVLSSGTGGPVSAAQQGYISWEYLPEMFRASYGNWSFIWAQVFSFVAMQAFIPASSLCSKNVVAWNLLALFRCSFFLSSRLFWKMFSKNVLICFVIIFLKCFKLKHFYGMLSCPVNFYSRKFLMFPECYYLMTG